MNRILVNIIRYVCLIGLLIVIQPLVNDSPGRYLVACGFALALSIFAGAATILNIMHYAQKEAEKFDE